MSVTEPGDRRPVVDGPAIPDEDDVPAEMAEQVLQEDGDLLMSDVLGIQMQIEAQSLPVGTDRHGGNGRDAVAPIPMSNHRRLAPWRPRAPDGRGQLEPGFIGKYEVRVQALGFFLIRGQTVRFQRAIAASSRSRARRSGFWQDQPNAARRRPTCVG